MRTGALRSWLLAVCTALLLAGPVAGPWSAGAPAGAAAAVAAQCDDGLCH